jgi:ubiquinone/menaquinone biosynthesis C-methylase UbiE
LILDVGCGTHGIGDVNCDLYIDDVGHRDGKDEKVIDTETTPNFVVCSAQNLPFISCTFDTVYSSHVIEHVPEPYQMFTELLRVSKNNVLIKCPHKDGSGAKLPTHINFFDFKVFETWAEKCRVKCACKVRSYDSVLPVQSRKYLPSKLADNKLLAEYLRFARKFLNPNKVVPETARPPFEIEVNLLKEEA